jgi:hypothetical protein
VAGQKLRDNPQGYPRRRESETIRDYISSLMACSHALLVARAIQGSQDFTVGHQRTKRSRYHPEEVTSQPMDRSGLYPAVVSLAFQFGQAKDSGLLG